MDRVDVNGRVAILIEGLRDGSSLGKYGISQDTVKGYLPENFSILNLNSMVGEF